MMKTLQRLGKSLMLPVAVLPVAAILMGIGYWITSAAGGPNLVSAFFSAAGGAIINALPILFAIGVAIGMSVDGEGTSALAGLVSWLMVQELLKPDNMALFQGIDVADVDPAFTKLGNAFIGMLCGLIGAMCYNKFKNAKLPDALSFFSGKRCVAIVTGGVTIVVSIVLMFVWPVVYNALVAFGEFIVGLGAVGSGLYGFFNRLLIPFGLHHALNAVFWFDIAGIDDIGKFLGTVEGGVRGVTGQYQTGFFPVMMFGLPGAALAMYHTAKTNQKKIAAGILLSASFASFFTGITEPLEFSFMFLAPPLYLAHAVLTGVAGFITTLLPVRSGFAFSAGFIDWFLSFQNPMAVNPWLLVPIGLCFAAIYYILFRFMITKFNLKTPGREDDERSAEELNLTINKDFTEMAKTILEGLGGKANIASLDNCITRLRIEVKQYELVDEKKIKSSGAPGIMRPSKTAVQVVIGTKVQFVADEMKRLMQQ